MNTNKKISLGLISIILTLFSVSPTFAGASNQNGNPYGNGTFFSPDGTFSGIMRGQNLTGVTQFTTYGSGSVTTVINNNIPGVTAIYYSGTSYIGSSQSVIDPASGQISSVFALAGPVPTGGSPSGGTTNNENSLINDAFLLHGAFTANLANSYPNQTFSGSGNVTLNDATIGQTNGQGQTVNPNQTNNTVPVTITTGSGTNGGSADFTITGVRINSQDSTFQ
jgi:hypothetical protein